MACFGNDVKLIFSCSRRILSSEISTSFSSLFEACGGAQGFGLPCICPIINSLSNRSVPASKSNFPPLALRNFSLRPTNQPCQKGCVAARSVRQVQGLGSFKSDDGCRSWRRSEGTEMRAAVVFRMVRERRLRFIKERIYIYIY